MIKVFAFLTTVLMTFASVARADVQSDYNNVLSKIDPIFQQSAPPTNRYLWFDGNIAYFSYWTNSPIDRADMDFGQVLIATYGMYCRKLGLPIKCLGTRLKVTFRMSGTSKTGSKLIQVTTANAGTFSSNSFIETIAKFYGQLEVVGGTSSLTAAESAIIAPGPTAAGQANLHILVDSAKPNSNIFWQDPVYRDAIFARISVLMKGLFILNNTASTINNAADFASKSQGDLLRKYDSVYMQPGSINTVISGPGTTDSLGQSWVFNNPRPFFIMRSWYNSPDNAYNPVPTDSNARIYLHELGHNMNLAHCDVTPKGSLCTDNLWVNPAGPPAVLNYLVRNGIVVYSYEY